MRQNPLTSKSVNNTQKVPTTANKRENVLLQEIKKLPPLRISTKTTMWNPTLISMDSFDNADLDRLCLGGRFGLHAEQQCGTQPYLDGLANYDYFNANTKRYRHDSVVLFWHFLSPSFDVPLDTLIFTALCCTAGLE